MTCISNVKLELQNVHWSKVDQNDIPEQNDENYKKAVRTRLKLGGSDFKIPFSTMLI